MIWKGATYIDFTILLHSKSYVMKCKGMKFPQAYLGNHFQIK